MWETSRVINNRRYHPFLWPWYVIASMIVLYAGILGVLYYFSFTEKNNPGQKLYEKAIETRRNELVNFKLSGLEPFIWKPMFNCRLLEDKPIENKNDSDCIQTELKFIPVSEKIVYNSFQFLSDQKIELYENVSEPCLICHEKKAGSAVKWTFNYQVKKPVVVVMASLWESRDFLYFNLFILVAMGLYLFMRMILRVTRANDLIAVAVKSGNGQDIEKIFNPEFKSELRMFLYIEITSGFVSGYIPRRNMLKLYKKYFTGEFNFNELDLRIGVVEYNSLSFEGLRIAQGIASRAVSSSVIVQDKVLAIDAGQDVKKAIWKRKNSQLEFNVIDIKKDK